MKMASTTLCVFLVVMVATCISGLALKGVVHKGEFRRTLSFRYTDLAKGKQSAPLQEEVTLIDETRELRFVNAKSGITIVIDYTSNHLVYTQASEPEKCYVSAFPETLKKKLDYDEMKTVITSKNKGSLDFPNQSYRFKVKNQEVIDDLSSKSLGTLASNLCQGRTAFSATLEEQTKAVSLLVRTRPKREVGTGEVIVIVVVVVLLFLL